MRQSEYNENEEPKKTNINRQRVNVTVTQARTVETL